jgi:hypothetical protein
MRSPATLAASFEPAPEYWPAVFFDNRAGLSAFSASGWSGVKLLQSLLKYWPKAAS